MRLNVMGIDPGKTTGIAVWLGQHPWHGSEIKHYQLNRESALKLISEWCVNAHRAGVSTLIGCESFTVRRSRTSVMTPQNDALEIIGAVKIITSTVNATLSMQTPAVAKRALPNDTLKRFGWWVSEVEGRHANDAARHVGAALLVHYPEILMTLHEHTNKKVKQDSDGTS